MTQSRGVIAGLALLATVVTIGAVGFSTTEEGLSLFDGLYTTVITISTVGFGEPGGGFSQAGKAVAIFVIVGGVGSALYTATAGLEVVFTTLLGGERARRKMRREIDDLEDHVIVCGFGVVGRNVWAELERGGKSTVVIEKDSERAESAREKGALVVEGNATYDVVLSEAGIDRASGLIACVQSDSDNLVIVLSAKALRPNLQVMARATEGTAEEKLLLAGADRVVAPQVLGAHRLAALVNQPQLADFIDLVVRGQIVQVAVEQCPVEAGAALEGKTLREADVRGAVGVTVLAVQEPDAEVQFNPDPDKPLAAGHVVIALGNPQQLETLRRLTTVAG